MRFEDMLAGTEWEERGLHWHAYLGAGSLCLDRSDLPPREVLRSPEQVAEWIRDRAAEGEPQLVRFGERWVRTTDTEFLDVAWFRDLKVAERGDSIICSWPAVGGGRTTVYVDAVAADQCPFDH
ncbi:hypothetical protein C1701_05260 [Actinoalloteichus sp. AHMU CJ021]|uniref:hypothetical protein n=1 Tax=Actinoalloteichus TaxID=65496 RepID=UPI0004AB8D24|nr:hypothetical protein [Actinoalloteichus caeruleus]AUS77876.1 hypothetical protein C1701_05260 [Actinoalloteichus sp. AHMU CJ021]